MHPQGSVPPNGSLIEPAVARRFVADNTRLAPVTGLSGLLLRQADEAHDLWHRTERELDAANLAPPFWAFAWAGGLGLARHVMAHPGTVRGRHVLDFATGSGLVALAAARAGAARVTACDIDPLALAATRLNAESNGVALETDDRDRVGESIAVDLVLAGDVFYDRQMAARLAPWFDALAAGGVEVLVGDPGRPYLPPGRAERVGCIRVETTLALEDARWKDVAIWRWRGGAG